MPRLRITTLFAALFLPILLCAGQAKAQFTIDYFNFNNGEPTNTTVYTTSPTITHSFEGGGFGNTNARITTNFAPANTYYLGGTTSGRPTGSSDLAGNALSFKGGTATTGGENGKNLIFQTSSLGYNGLKLSFATQYSSSTGFNNNTLSYSTDGTNYSFFANYTPADSSFAIQTFDLNTITALNNKSNVYFKITFSGATNAGSNNRIDNLLLTAATPAPAGVMSMGIGLGMAGLGALVRRRRAV